MATSSKRLHSSIGDGVASIDAPFKRRSLILTNGLPNHIYACGRPTDHSFHVSRERNLDVLGRSTHSTSVSDAVSDFSSKEFASNDPDASSEFMNPKLVEAVARYSDSDTDNESRFHEFSARSDNSQFVANDLYQRRKSMSRPGSFSSSSSKKSLASKLDMCARERCFDYIVQSIDEVWARYCDTTSCAEAKVYGNLSDQKAANLKQQKANQPEGRVSMRQLHHSHKPLTISDKETESESECETSIDIQGPQNEDYDDENSGYKSEATIPTEYETDYGESRTVSNLPDSVKLQSLKFRLTNAKNDLEQVHDSKEVQDSNVFWMRWDMIKYSAVEMMEEDDDDELIESVIEELEQGRSYTY